MVSKRKIFVISNTFGSYDEYYEKIVGIINYPRNSTNLSN